MPPYQSHTLRSHAFEQRHCIMAYFVTHSLQFRDGVEEGRKLNEEQLIQRNTIWAIAGRALLVNCHKHYIGRHAIQCLEGTRNPREGTLFNVNLASTAECLLSLHALTNEAVFQGTRMTMSSSIIRFVIKIYSPLGSKLVVPRYSAVKDVLHVASESHRLTQSSITVQMQPWTLM